MSSVLSLDISLTNSGWAVGEDGTVIAHGAIPGRHEGMLRLIWNRNRILDQVDKVKPDMIVMEGLAMRSMTGHNLERTGLAYMVRAELCSDHLQWIEVSPQSLKKFIIGRGGSKKNPAPKSLILKYIATQFKHTDVDCDDVADALGLNYIGMALMGDWTPTTEAQRDVLEKLGISQPAQQLEPAPFARMGRDGK